MGPTEEQIAAIRQQVYEEEIRALIVDTIAELQRLGDKLETYVTDKISQEVPTSKLIAGERDD